MLHATYQAPTVPTKKHLLISVILMFAAGFVLHFLYDWTSAVPLLQALLAPLVPINESVWEHGKLALLPLLAWWMIFYFLRAKPASIPAKPWFTAATIALYTSVIAIPLLHYFYTTAFGVQSVLLDILILLIALVFGQLLGVHWLHHRNRLPIPFGLSLLLCALLLGCFFFFTFAPPALPWFTPHTEPTHTLLRIRCTNSGP